MPGLTGLVVADDLTGGGDTGHQFAARGVATRVALSPDAPAGDAQVLVVNTDSRSLSATDATARVRDAVDGRDAGFVYKKVDSTLRGNVVAETEAVTAASGADRAVVAPAFPAADRVTAAGYHLVEGRLVADAYGADPDAPATSHLGRLFADGDLPARTVSVATVARGASAVADALADCPTPGVACCDAVHDSHLAAVAAAGAEVDAVFVGSAGLARHVPLDANGPGPVSVPRESRTVLGVAGSVNPATRSSVAELPDAVVVSVDPVRAVADPEKTGAEAAARAARTLDSEGTAVLASAVETDAPERALAAGTERGFDRGVVRERIERTLADAATGAFERAAPDAFFLTGGAVAGAVLRALDARGIDLSGEAVAAGVPVGRIAGGDADGRPVVTKAGGFGSPDAIANCLARLGGDDV